MPCSSFYSKRKKPAENIKLVSVPDGNISEDDMDSDWPIQCEKPQRCKADGCTRRTRFLCSKCQVYLCTTGTKCFLDYHGVSVI